VEIRGTNFMSDQEAKKAQREEIIQKKFIPMLDQLEALVANSSGGVYAVGTAMSVADIWIYALMDQWESGFWNYVPKDIAAGRPRLERLFAAVKANPEIAAYEAKEYPTYSVPAI
jgi:glutathione S-transferase